MKQRSARAGRGRRRDRGRKLGELGDTLGSRVMRARGERLAGAALLRLLRTQGLTSRRP